MSAPARPRPHRRAVRQLLLGLVPLLLVEAVCLTVLSVRLADARAPLDAATSSGRATVVATGRPPDGRGVSVTLDDAGRTRRGVLVLADPGDATSVPAGTQLAVQFDPSDPTQHTAVYLDGDAAHRRVADLLFGVILLAVVAGVTTLVTAGRFVTRPRLRRKSAVPVAASRVVVRRGLLVRSWLELATDRGVRWLPVHWAPELAALAPGSPIDVRGNPARARLVLPVVDGAELWPSGRLRTRPPRGNREVTDPLPETAGVGWARQIRVDAVPLIAAPLLGLLWAFVDSSGLGGFFVATAVVAGLLFWLTELLGSDPAPPDRD